NDRSGVLSDVESMIGEKVSPKQLFNLYFIQTELQKKIKKMAMSSIEATETIDRILAIRSFIESCGDTVTDALAKIEGIDRKQISNDNTPKILISSIHKAKGLEWPVVIIPGLEHDKFPYTV